jgi:ABC-type branched-subunit amino acid transport system substrate-binding protein
MNVRRGPRSRTIAVAATVGLVLASCGSDEANSDAGTAAPTTAAPATAAAPTTDGGSATTGAPSTTGGSETTAEPNATTAAPPSEGRDFLALAPPTGEEIVIGFVNTEGPAGLNFPEIAKMFNATADFLNEHGGIGGRPVKVESCITDASPEKSQACAQELAGKNVEMVYLGLDLFPDYRTYEAAAIPVVGVLPLFPADYAAEALYLIGGNVVLGAGIAGFTKEFFKADNVAIVSADNPGANGSEAAAIAALEAAGITYKSIKGSDTETDAGFQALVQEALKDNPQVLISLYGDAGCVGMMRGRAALGSDVPVIASNTCANGGVLESAGDAAKGWFFQAAGDRDESIESRVMKEALAPAAGVSPDELIVSNLGLGSLSPIMLFTIADAANQLAATNAEVTGQAIYDFAKANASGDLKIFPEGGPLTCGAAPGYRSVCNFEQFFGEYSDGTAVLVPGFERFSALPYLP